MYYKTIVTLRKRLTIIRRFRVAAHEFEISLLRYIANSWFSNIATSVYFDANNFKFC